MYCMIAYIAKIMIYFNRLSHNKLGNLKLFSGYIYDIIIKNFYDFKSFYTFVAMKKGLF